MDVVEVDDRQAVSNAGQSWLEKVFDNGKAESPDSVVGNGQAVRH